jgi:chorismate mutase-like protein
MTDRTMPPDGLELLRSELDDIDVTLLDTLRRRLECCIRIARHKAEHDIAMMQPARVGLVKDRAAQYGREHGIDPDFLVALYGVIIAETCRVEDVEIADATAH